MGVTRKKSLSRGRPPTARPVNAAFSRRAARTLINRHHHLEKKRQKAVKEGDETTAKAASAEITALGGLERYQQASLLGQSKGRGGDSSRVLLEWIKHSISSTDDRSRFPRIRMLEVGALSTTNACATSGYFETERIDLNSQAPGILQQDFMERPLPPGDSDCFDIISLSLVLNFVPEPAGRGDMLRHATAFLRVPDPALLTLRLLPSIFIVLPKSCLLNSRYCSEELFTDIMHSLGFSKVQRKVTGKLYYSLWRRDTATASPTRPFPKKEINPGAKRNNFAVVLKTSESHKS
ncbi:hypothetical protein jhhlp_001171 [Lomentospora prolificans]|uniref:25S rRNA adenine-N(1) methyltransferase n=1 Tax=Lomentospora prolificans TaxID=41688 RepID=A0A2N3NHI7_9PEZI|nr:hypothetical protein jhhlp_001171 [Lomentospora prolificans]